MTVEQKDPFGYRPINVTFVEMAMHAGFIALLAYWSFVLVSPFLPIIVWSVVLAVALYPIYDWLTSLLRGRQRLAATTVTIAGLLVVIGPDSLRPRRGCGCDRDQPRPGRQRRGPSVLQLAEPDLDLRRRAGRCQLRLPGRRLPRS